MKLFYFQLYSFFILDLYGSFITYHAWGYKQAPTDDELGPPLRKGEEIKLPSDIGYAIIYCI